MSEVRVGASSITLDPTHKNCVGLLLRFVSVALGDRRGWQTNDFEDLVGRQPTTLIRPDRTVHRREDTWRRGCRVWSRSFGKLGASEGCPTCFRWSGRTSVFTRQGEPLIAVTTPACSKVPIMVQGFIARRAEHREVSGSSPTQN